MKKKTFVRDEWHVLSDKFVRHQRLPYGTKLVLEHQFSGSSKRRKVRNDMTFTRHLFNGRADDDNTVTELIKQYLVPALTVDPESKNLLVKLIGPNGEMPNGNTKVKKVRKYPPLPTANEIEEENIRQAEIDEIAKIADSNLRVAEELRDYTELVLRGTLKALILRYGRTTVDEALAKE